MYYFGVDVMFRTVENFWSNIRFSSAFSPHMELKVTHRFREVNLLFFYKVSANSVMIFVLEQKIFETENNQSAVQTSCCTPEKASFKSLPWWELEGIVWTLTAITFTLIFVMNCTNLKSCTIANPERSFKTSYVEMNFGMACLSKKQKELFWI